MSLTQEQKQNVEKICRNLLAGGESQHERSRSLPHITYFIKFLESPSVPLKPESAIKTAPFLQSSSSNKEWMCHDDIDIIPYQKMLLEFLSLSLSFHFFLLSANSSSHRANKSREFRLRDGQRARMREESENFLTWIQTGSLYAQVSASFLCLRSSILLLTFACHPEERDRKRRDSITTQQS